MEEKKLYKYKGNFSYYLEKKAERQEQLSSTIDKARNTFKKELDLHLSIYCPLFLKVGGTYEVKFYVGKLRDIAVLDFAIPQDGGLSPIVTLRVK